uniref:mitogen-activated protein kinase n=1 Tax=Cyprinus carpio TaxID=7962 RepID=A0A8C2B7N6_CYPCA
MKHDNVIGLLDVFTADLSLDRFHDFYLVMPFMGTDLGKLMKMERLSEDRVQYLVYQILRGLKVNKAFCLILQILDFGLARQADSEMTGYVVTRWYRAPEVILSWMHYTQTVDIWSVGCIMAEMLLGKPLFKGNDHLDQLMEIMKITGTPTKEFTAKLQSEDARNYIAKLPKLKKKDLRTLLPNVNPQAIHVLESMLLLDPESRITAAEGLALPFFSDFREPEEETEAPPYDHSLDEAEQSLEKWKKLTFTEILTFHPAPAVTESKETAL